jgi:glucose-6-phosphate isomerase
MSLKFNYSTSADTTHKSFQSDFLKTSLNSFKDIINAEANGFFHLTDRSELISQTQEIYSVFKDRKHFVQIGIGGSALGPQMLVSALGNNTNKTFTILDNPDSDFIFDELSKINIKDAVFYVVSKSGGTAETVACYSIIRNLLKENGVKEEQFKDYFVFCTDLKNGQLRAHVDENSFHSLEVPSNVGGRFSVLTHVGLFPALFMGVNIEQFFSGANELKSLLLSDDAGKNPLLQTAAHISYLFNEKNINETVMMPYSSKLKDFSFWFVQLWAESLGKYQESSKSNVGLTPIPGYGATDQHSQMQLFMEGPYNKLMFLLNIKNRKYNYNLDSNLMMESGKKLAPHSMNELLEAEFQGTLKALNENKRDFIQIEIDTLNETTLAQLILFFESLTALMGHYLKIDPFNQPGVEKGKIYAYEYLNSLR